MKNKHLSQQSSKRKSALILIGLPFLAGLLFPVLPALAAVPADPAVELRFPEGTNGYGGAGVTTTNTGDLSGLATFATDDPADLSGYPMFTTNVPTGTYTPSGNSYSVDMGPVYGTNYGRAVDLYTTANPPGNSTLGAFTQLTVCGWLNCRFLQRNARIAYALESDGGNGFDLGHCEYGPISLGINEDSHTAGPVSVTQITQDPNVGTNNWLFFAATYDSTLGADQLNYYFGKRDQLAFLDSTYTYAGGPAGGGDPAIHFTGPLTVGNYGVVGANRDATGTYEPIQMFQGLLDEIKVYSNAFTIDQVQQAQINGAVTPVAATILNQPANLSVFSGQNATFDVRATGSGTVYYHWQVSVNNGTTFTSIADATNASLTLASVGLGDNGKLLRVQVTNSLGGPPFSSNAKLTVQSAAPQLFQLSFTEGGSGKATTNACAYFGGEGMNANTPGFTNLVPIGPWAPNTNFNQYSLFNGFTGNGGNRGVDLYTTNSLAASPNSGNGAPNWVGTLNAFTITAWINIGQAGSRTAGTLGSAIFHCSDNSANQPNGIEITYKTVECGAQYNGNLACVINDDADWDTGSTGTYPLMSTVSIGNPDILSGATSGCDPTNWVFFAITWDGPNTNLTYYFGSGLDAATQDVSRISFNRFGVAQTNIPNTGQGTVGGYNLSGGSSRTGNSGATRGCIDEFNMFNRVLTLAEIRNVQIGGTVPPVLGVSSTPPNATVAWGPKTTPQMEFQLQSRTNLSAGVWGDVTNAPTDSGNTRSLALGETNAARFFRLRNK